MADDNLESLQDLFGNRIFVVPDYQRGYAWGKQQLQDFLDDVDLLQNENHYTGTIVLIKREEYEKCDRGIIYGTYEVVDGQQRLTTSVLTLCAIAVQLQTFRRDGESLAEGISRSYLHTKKFGSGADLFKLRLNLDNDNYFQGLISGKSVRPNIRSHKMLRDALAYISAELEMHKSKMSRNAYFDWLELMREKITLRLRFTVQEMGSHAEVGMVFESMNNRGKPINEFEKVKNYLLYLSSKIGDGGHVDKNVNDIWSSVYRGLSQSGLPDPRHEDQVLRCHWIVGYSSDNRRWSGMNTIKTRFPVRSTVLDTQSMLRDVNSYTESLGDAAKEYCWILKRNLTRPKGADDLTREIYQESSRFHRLNVAAPFMPILMAFRLKYPDLREQYLNALVLSELYGFRVFRILGKRSDAGRSDLYKLGHGLYNKSIRPEDLIDKFSILLEKYSPYESVCQELERKIDWFAWSAGIKYFLFEYELEHDARKGGKYWRRILNLGNSSIEHILPQKPISEYWRRNFSDADRLKYTNGIGNLTLTLDNSRYKNKDFLDKRGEHGVDGYTYANGSFAIERNLLQFGDWTPSQIGLRRDEILAWAKERWRSPF